MATIAVALVLLVVRLVVCARPSTAMLMACAASLACVAAPKAIAPASAMTTRLSLMVSRLVMVLGGVAVMMYYRV